MKLTIRTKLFLSILTTTILCVFVVIMVQKFMLAKTVKKHRQEVASQMLSGMANKLAIQFSHRGDWQFIADKPLLLNHLASYPNKEPIENGQYLASNPTSKHKLISANIPADILNGLTVLDVAGNRVAGAPKTKNTLQKEIYLHDELIGYLTLELSVAMHKKPELQLLRDQLQALSWTALFVVLAAAVAAALIARTIGEPIKALTDGTLALSAGNYTKRLSFTRIDEFSLLAKYFNSLALTLERSQQSRQQWVADISHELRTPITVLQAELEAIEDGYLPLTQEAIKSFGSEVRRLSLLVDDLNQLAQVDSGNLVFDKAAVDLDYVISESLGRFQEQFTNKKLSIERNSTLKTAVYADENRLKQLFANLIENSIKYTKEGGVVRFAIKTKNDFAVITIDDSAPSVPSDSLPLLFDRLYRVDSSRSRLTGSSGLGLAICDSIVKAHDGDIKAVSSALGGLRVIIKLPLFNAMN